MAFKVYILNSQRLNRHYIGQTANLELRLKQHTEKHNKGSFTYRANDWKVVLVLDCGTRDQARRLERFLKRMKSARFISKLISDQNMQINLVERFK
jgi:putative endonuclease